MSTGSFKEKKKCGRQAGVKFGPYGINQKEGKSPSVRTRMTRENKFDEVSELPDEERAMMEC